MFSMSQTLNLYSTFLPITCSTVASQSYAQRNSKEKWINGCWGWREQQWNEFLPLVKSRVNETWHLSAPPCVYPMKNFTWFTLFLGSSMHQTPWSGAAAMLSLLITWAGSAMTLKCSHFTDIIFHHHFHHQLRYLKCYWWLKAKSCR